MARQKREALLFWNEIVGELLTKLKVDCGYLDQEEALQTLGALSEALIGEIATIRHHQEERQRLLREVEQAGDYQKLCHLHEQLNTFEQELFLQLPSVPALHHSVTAYRDLLATCTLQLVEKEMERSGKGMPPLPYSLICMGSDGREEQTLLTDQDYLIVYANGGDTAVDDYFDVFSQLLVERLAEVGFKKCTGNIMPSNPTWRGSLNAWQKRLHALVRFEYEEYTKNLMDIIVLSDVRHVIGHRPLSEQLIEMVHQFERNYFQVIWEMAKAASDMKLALGFWNRFWTDKAGPHKGKINLKLLAWAPLVMNVRLLAVHQGISETNTLRRIASLREAEVLSPGTASDLAHAYHLFTRHRVHLQIQAVREGWQASYFLDPRQLTADERDELRWALLQTRELQKIVQTRFTIL